MPAAQIISGADLELARASAAPLDEVLPADPHAPWHARRLLEALEQCSVPPERMSQVLVAVSEAVTNSVLHAYEGDEAGAIRLRAWTLDEALAVLIEDEGRGFDPRNALRGTRTGLGLGLSLMLTLATELRVQSQPGLGAAVFLIFRP